MADTAELIGLRRGKERVALDVDDTIANILDQIIMEYNGRNGTKHRLWSETGTSTVPHSEASKLYNPVWMDRMERIGLLVDRELLKRAARHYEIDLVTSRGGVPSFEETISQLRGWLRMNGLDGYRLVINDRRMEKTELGYHWYVDDAVALADEVNRTPGKRMLLVDMFYNRGVQNSASVRRVADVNAGLEALIRLKEPNARVKVVS